MRHKLLLSVLAVTAALMIVSLGIALGGDVNVTINGVPVEGANAFGIASGGVFISLVAAIFALVMIAVVAASASMIVTIICVLALLALIICIAPIFLPGVFVALAIMWLVRRKRS